MILMQPAAEVNIMKVTTEFFNLYRIDSKQPGPQVLVTAGVHCDEYEPMLAAMELIMELPGILISGSVTIVPVVNTSAYSIGSRYGEDGLDLARTCPGNANGSVTEKIAYAVSEGIREADYYIDLHTGGAVYDICPLTGYMLHPSIEVLKKQRQLAEAFNLPIIWGTDAQLQGRTLSVARDANVPAIYVEFGGGCLTRKHIVEAYKRGCINVIKSIGMADNTAGPDSMVTYRVEDHTINSGYLQDKMPAPATGIFTPDITLGSIIEKMQLWGKIFDPASGETFPVKAEKSGLAFLLRASSFVQKGNSLGGILPISEPGNITINGN